MKKTELIWTTIIAICVGTSMHFAHHLPFFGHFMGYIFPVNECVWEHMKMLFYPLMLTACYMCLRERSIKAFGGQILSCLIAIPMQIALFFAYWIFTQESCVIVDIVAYIVVMTAAIGCGTWIAQEDWIRRHWPLFVVIAVAMIVLLAVLTYHNPGGILFNPGL